MDKPIQLSEPIAGVFKYFAPFIIAFVSTIWYMENNQGLVIPVLIILVGLAYWLFRLLPLKSVKLEGNFLIISNDFKKDRIHLDDIDKLNTSGWSLYITHIHFKRQTSFGKTIMFATMQNGFSNGISDRVQNILTQIKDNIDKKK